MRDKVNKRRIWGTVLTVVGIVILVVSSLSVLVWRRFGYVEHYANCSDGITVWRRNPGAFASYRYRVKRGITTLESGLSMKELREFLDGYSCVILGGG